MNKDRLKEVRDLILTNNRFNYSAYCLVNNISQEAEWADFNSCNTVGCVAGWTISKYKDEYFDDGYEFYPHFENAKAMLNLSHSEADFLFCGAEYKGFKQIDLYKATIDDAIERIDFLLTQE